MNSKNFTWRLAGLLIGMTALSTAAPIRVGIFKGVGGGSYYWHPSIHPGSAAIADLLTNPAQAGFTNPVLPVRGIAVTMYGVDTSCASAGCAPSAPQLTTFIKALDSLDVVIFPNNVGIGGAIVDSLQRLRLKSFWSTKGMVSLHWSTDSKGHWPAWDSLHGTQFLMWQNMGNATLHLDTVGSSRQLPSWKFLNRGLPDTARFTEEWISFTHTGAAIRSRAHLVPTVNLDEDSYEGNINSGIRMGDHPMSWYREFPEGGRFFYTGIGHRPDVYTGSAFFRRQVYNAVLWAARVDTNGITALHPAGRASAGLPLKTWVSGSRVHVQVAEGASVVELFSLNGTRLAAHPVNGAETVTLEKPMRSGTYIVRVRDTRGMRSALVAL